MKVRISAPQFEPETIAKARFMSKKLDLSFQATLEKAIETGMEVNTVNDAWNKLSPEEKNKYCKGLDLKY